MNYLIFVFIALFIGIFKEIFKKNILGKIEPVQFIIIFYSFMFLFAHLSISQISMPSLFEFGLIILSAFFYGFANIYGLAVLKKLDISLIKPLFSFENVIVLMLGFFILGEILSLIQLFGMMFIILPLIYLGISEFKNHEFNYKDLIYIFLAMMFAAFTGILDKLVLGYVNSFTYFYFLKLFILVIVGIYYLFFCKEMKFEKQYLKKNSLKIFGLAIFTSIGTYSYFYALENPLSNLIIVKLILTTSLLITTLVGGKYFHEHDLKVKSVAALFGVIGLSLLILY